ncbi:MAG: diguanylate cyclase [Acidobacteria bacterium]|nr:diguanylate cyclase [Acidobacteriota bacterium]
MRILIAEDEPISRHMLESFLTQWGYEVIVAHDGDEAWWTLQREDAPALAILDWMMPGMDGTQICREVRKRIGAPYTYLILLTAKSQKQDIVQGLEAGADDYLTKPFDPDELRVRLRAGRRILDLQEQFLSMREAARFPNTHDFMTGLWNREAILGMLRQKLGRDRHDAAPVGVILVDLDHFKQINATYGAAAGDAVLREAARRVRSCVRLYDSVGRYGGGEFLIVVPGCYSSEVIAIAEKVRATMSREPMDILGGAIVVTASVGVAATDENKNASADLLLRGAGEAARKAKGHRNRVELATAADAEP